MMNRFDVAKLGDESSSTCQPSRATRVETAADETEQYDESSVNDDETLEDELDSDQEETV
jgi:hypothetical protein